MPPLIYDDDDLTDEERGDIASREAFGHKAPRFTQQNESEYEKRFKQVKKNQSKKQNEQQQQQQQQKDPNKEKFEKQILELRQENPDLTFEHWSEELLKRRLKLDKRIPELLEHFPDMLLPLDFVLSVKTILNVSDITLPFMGIIFGAPSSLKTQVIEILRKFWYSFYTDNFTAASFVSHSVNVPKEKLPEIDMLPQIKDKLVLTKELAPLFTGKEDDMRKQFGIITSVLDGKGFENNSGVHGKRGYSGEYMFTWIGAAVKIPNSVYKFLSTIGFKIYFLQLDKTEVKEEELVQQLKINLAEKMNEIESLLFEYLMWFEICPISQSKNSAAKIQWDQEKDDTNAIVIISRLAILLAHLRGFIYVSRTSDNDDLINPETNEIKMYTYETPTIENPSRAVRQLYNLARGHALSYGRNYITKEDLSLIIKVVLSTSSFNRVLIFNLLIEHKGTLTTSMIVESLDLTADRAKKTMTEFKGLGLVTIEKNGDSKNTEYTMKLDEKFDWFKQDEFSELRGGFKQTKQDPESSPAKNTPRDTQQDNTDSSKNNTQDNTEGA